MSFLQPSNVPDAEQSEEINVTLADQNKINRFARLNLKEDDLDKSLAELKRYLENVNEASDELMFGDDDEDGLGDADDDMSGSGKAKGSNIFYLIGDSFMGVTKDEADTLLNGKKKELETEIKQLEVKVTSMKEEMSNIKAELYAKFGKNINLDADENAIQ